MLQSIPPLEVPSLDNIFIPLAPLELFNFKAYVVASPNEPLPSTSNLLPGLVSPIPTLPSEVLMFKLPLLKAP